MIRFLYDGKPCYANVYVYDTYPKEYHVHTVSSLMHDNLPDSLVLVDKNEKLCLREPDAVAAELADIIAVSITDHLSRKR